MDIILQSPSQTHANRRAFFLLILAVGVYLVFQAVLIRSVQIAQYDESIYLDVARNIRRTGLPLRSFGAEGFLLLDQTPLYPYLLGGLGVVVGDNVLLLRLATVVAGVGTLVMAFWIGWRARGTVSGLVAALLLAVNPFLVVYSFFVRMELFLCFFLLLATYWVMRWEQTGRKAFLWGASVAVVTAVLFKVVGVFYCAAAVVYLFLRAPTWRQRFSQALWMGIPTAIGLVLWLSMTLLEPERLQLRLARWFGAMGSSGSAIIDPRLGIAAWPWLQIVGANVVGWGMVALFFVALIVFFVSRSRLPIVWLLLLYLLFTIGASLVMQLKEPRHVIGLIPITAVAIALMIDWDAAWKNIPARTAGRAVVLVAAFLFLWWVSPLNFPAAYQATGQWWTPLMANRIYANDADLQPLVEIGAYLKQQSRPEDVILVARQGPVVGYYADRSYLFLYTEPFAKNMTALADSEFVVMDSTDFWQQTPEETQTLLQYLADHFSGVFQAGPVVVYRRVSE